MSLTHDECFWLIIWGMLFVYWLSDTYLTKRFSK